MDDLHEEAEVIRLRTRSHRGDAKLERIARVPLFSGLTTAELETVAREADEVRVPAGYRLIRQGALGHEFVVLLEGNGVVDRDGEPIRTLGPGDYAGEIALLTNRGRTASVTTTTPARLLVFSEQGFRRIANDVPALATRLLAGFGSHIVPYLAA
jgi:CRP-like cAMP-binding protein